MTLLQATAQLQSAETSPGSAFLRVWTPRPGEGVIEVPASAPQISIDGHPPTASTAKNQPVTAGTFQRHPGMARGSENRPTTAHTAGSTLVLGVAAGVSTIDIRW